MGTASGFGLGDHICWTHRGRREWVAAAVAYLHEGADAGERLLYVADRPPQALLDDLAGLPGRDAMLASGQLLVLPLDRVYGGSGEFDAGVRVREYEKMARDAVADGYRGFRLAAEATSLVLDDADARAFAAYELAVDRVIAASPMSAMCGYDIRRAHEVETLGFVHPLCNHAAAPDPGAGFYADAGGWVLTGELDLINAGSLAVALQHAVAEADPDADVQVDASGLRFIDVACARALVEAGAALAPGRSLVLRRSPGVLERLLRLGWPDAAGLAVRAR